MLIRFQRKVHQTRKEYLQKETIRSQGKISEIKNLTSLKKIQGKNYKIKLKKPSKVKHKGQDLENGRGKMRQCSEGWTLTPRQS